MAGMCKRFGPLLIFAFGGLLLLFNSVAAQAAAPVVHISARPA